MKTLHSSITLCRVLASASNALHPRSNGYCSLRLARNAVRASPSSLDDLKRNPPRSVKRSLRGSQIEGPFLVERLYYSGCKPAHVGGVREADLRR